MPYALEKSIFASKTFWVNLVTTAVAMLTLLSGQEWIADYPKVTAAIGVALGLLNIALRWVTVDTVKFLAVIFMLSLASAAVGSSANAEERFGGYTYDELGSYQPGPNVVRAENRDDAGDYRRWKAIKDAEKAKQPIVVAEGVIGDSKLDRETADAVQREHDARRAAPLSADDFDPFPNFKPSANVRIERVRRHKPTAVVQVDPFQYGRTYTPKPGPYVYMNGLTDEELNVIHGYQTGHKWGNGSEAEAIVNSVVDPLDTRNYQRLLWLEHDLRDGGASARENAAYWERREPQTELTKAFAAKDRARADAVERVKKQLLDAEKKKTGNNFNVVDVVSVAVPRTTRTSTKAEHDAYLRWVADQAKKAPASPTACYVDSKGVRHCPGTTQSRASRGGLLKRLLGK